MDGNTFNVIVAIELGVIAFCYLLSLFRGSGPRL
jgi:hypothetical protein